MCAMASFMACSSGSDMAMGRISAPCCISRVRPANTGPELFQLGEQVPVTRMIQRWTEELLVPLPIGAVAGGADLEEFAAPRRVSALEGGFGLHNGHAGDIGRYRLEIFVLDELQGHGMHAQSADVTGVSCPECRSEISRAAAGRTTGRARQSRAPRPFDCRPHRHHGIVNKAERAARPAPHPQPMQKPWLSGTLPPQGDSC